MYLELFCNKCFEQRRFNQGLCLYASRCGHIICRACLLEKCPVCSNPFTPVSIDNNMTANVADYFRNPIIMYKRIQNIIKFQKDQQTLLISHMYEENVKFEKEYEGYKKMYEKLQPKIQQEQERICKLKDYISYHERSKAQPKCMTPPIIGPIRSRYPVPSQQSYLSSIEQKRLKCSQQRPRTPIFSHTSTYSSTSANNTDKQSGTHKFSLKRPLFDKSTSKCLESNAISVDGNSTSSTATTSSQMLKPKMQRRRSPTNNNISTDSLSSGKKLKSNTSNQSDPSQLLQQLQLSPGTKVQRKNNNMLSFLSLC